MEKGQLLPGRHLLVVTRNVNTDSPWPISTNPNALFNNLNLTDCDLRILLWKPIRASTAVPSYFEPEKLQWNPNDPIKAAVFKDGGGTPYNNPAFLLYRMATLLAYRCGWPEGGNRMMLVSIGTGTRFRVKNKVNPFGQSFIGAAKTIPSVLMRSMAVEADICCRQVGRCVSGAEIDLELRGMTNHSDCEPEAIMESTADSGRKAFLYARYDPDVSQKGLAASGLTIINAGEFAMDNVAMIDDLFCIGGAAAQEQVDFQNHFAAFIKPGSAS